MNLGLVAHLLEAARCCELLVVAMVFPCAKRNKNWLFGSLITDDQCWYVVHLSLTNWGMVTSIFFVRYPWRLPSWLRDCYFMIRTGISSNTGYSTFMANSHNHDDSMLRQKMSKQKVVMSHHSNTTFVFHRWSLKFLLSENLRIFSCDFIRNGALLWWLKLHPRKINGWNPITEVWFRWPFLLQWVMAVGSSR